MVAVSAMAASTEAVGLIAVLIACVFFGSNFVVTKKYKTGDGESPPHRAACRSVCARAMRVVYVLVRACATVSSSSVPVCASVVVHLCTARA